MWEYLERRLESVTDGRWRLRAAKGSESDKVSKDSLRLATEPLAFVSEGVRGPTESSLDETEFDGGLFV